MRSYQIWLIVCFTMMPSFVISANPLANQWEASISAYEKQDNQEAIRELKEWITAAEAKGIRSADAHFNLGVLYWAGEDSGNSSEQLMTSSKLSSTPWSLWQVHSAMDQLQQNLGIQSPVTKDLGFRFKLYTPTNLLFAISFLSLWAILLLFKSWRAQWIPMNHYQLIGAVSVPVLLILLTIGSHTIRKKIQPFGVLKNSEGNITLLESEEADSETILELPPGTLVSIGEVKAELVKINGPIEGWVRAGQVSY